MTVFTGTAGDDSILGTSDGDDFHLEQGGNDSASGGAGIDVFYMGAAFNAADQLDGGGGTDYLMLDGDYSAGVALTASTLKNIERITVAAGHSYNLSGLSDANIGGHMIIDASALATGDSLHMDASAVTSALLMIGGGGADVLTGGSGADSLEGGGGHDTLSGGGGNDLLILGDHAEAARGGDGDDLFNDNGVVGFTVRDKIDGGAGDDRLTLSGTYDALVFGDKTMRNIETLEVGGDHAASVTLADGNVAAGQTLTVFAHNDMQSDFVFFTFDGSAETDGVFNVSGGFHYDTLIGGAGADHLTAAGVFSLLSGGGGDDLLQGDAAFDNLRGGAGADTLLGGAGPDTLDGGLGADVIDGGTSVDTFVYASVKDSTAAAPDQIASLGDSETIDLHLIDADRTVDGDQAFHLVSAFTGQAGELVVAFDAIRHLTTISGDVDGDGQADLVIDVAGGHADYNHFVL